MEPEKRQPKPPQKIRALVIVYSYHHGNTRMIAEAIGRVLDGTVKTPSEVTPDAIRAYDLVGFGSGIYSGTFDPGILGLAGGLPQADGRTRTFVFSTYGAPAAFATREFVEKNHRQIRECLETKGYPVLGEFGCAGWNTNSFLTYLGGLNKGRPDEDDILDAEAFALKMVEKARG